MSRIVWEAEEAAVDAGLAVAAGRMTEEDAGTMWLAYADANYDAGVIFESAFRKTLRTIAAHKAARA